MKNLVLILVLVAASGCATVRVTRAGWHDSTPEMRQAAIRELIVSAVLSYEAANFARWMEGRGR